MNAFEVGFNGMQFEPTSSKVEVAADEVNLQGICILKFRESLRQSLLLGMSFEELKPDPKQL